MYRLPSSHSTRTLLLLAAVMMVLCQGLNASHLHLDRVVDHECLICQQKNADDSAVGVEFVATPGIVAGPVTLTKAITAPTETETAFWGRAPPLTPESKY